MATTLADIIVPEVFANSIIEETTLTDSFLQSGVLAPLPELNLSSPNGGNFVNIPFYKANLSGNYSRLNDSSSLTPNKIEQSSQIGVVITSGDAFSARQLAGQKIGSNSPGSCELKLEPPCSIKVATSLESFTKCHSLKSLHKFLI